MTDLNEKLGIEIKIPDPLKRRVTARQSFHRPWNKQSKNSNRPRSARDTYAKRKKQTITQGYFSKKNRW